MTGRLTAFCLFLKKNSRSLFWSLLFLIYHHFCFSHLERQLTISKENSYPVKMCEHTSFLYINLNSLCALSFENCILVLVFLPFAERFLVLKKLYSFFVVDVIISLVLLFCIWGSLYKNYHQRGPLIISETANKILCRENKVENAVPLLILADRFCLREAE